MLTEQKSDPFGIATALIDVNSGTYPDIQYIASCPYGQKGVIRILQLQSLPFDKVIT